MPGIVIYNGPSMIDGQPIVVVAIKSSSNKKTGDMIQTHILRADISPMDASKTGADYSICGSCKHRGIPSVNPDKKQAENRTCYVTLFQGPTVVFKGFKRGIYPDATMAPETVKSFSKGCMVRLGTYGDPLAVPAYVWDNLLSESIGGTGYTHQNTMLPKVAQSNNALMVSADNAQEAITAHSKGYRTFRVIPVSQWANQGKTSLLKNEILCPASNEGQPKSGKVECIDCKLCDGNIGNKVKSIAIVAHGANKNYVV